MVAIHPFLKILLFILTLVLTGLANAFQLSLMLSVLLFLIVCMKHQNYVQVLLRMRWLFLSILFIYAFGTPGELVPQFPIQFAPTYEGLNLGLMQLARFMIALAALNLLLTSRPSEEMILGLYLLLWPLRFLGLNVGRFAARLILTLHYVEELAESNKQVLSFDGLNFEHENVTESAVKSVNIKQQSFSLLDKIILTAILLLFALVCWNT
jgi:energy-coupling factor transporter transmembrane protein EcfT